MKEDIDALSVRIERLLGLMKRLSEDNLRLRDALQASEQERERMQTRMNEARVRVEAALARLPLPTDPQASDLPTEEAA